MFAAAGGGGGGGDPPAVTLTLSNVDVLSALVLWLVTASPMLAVAAIDTVVVPTEIHVFPSAER